MKSGKGKMEHGVKSAGFMACVRKHDRQKVVSKQREQNFFK